MDQNDLKNITARVKAKAALEAVRGERPLDEIARAAGADTAQLARWRDQLATRAARLFEDEERDVLMQQQMRANEALLIKLFEHKSEEDALRASSRVLHQLLAHQDQTGEDERKRIAREIHDDLGQNLLAVRIDISMLHARTAQRHPRLHRRAGLALENIDVTITSIRTIINDLRPFELDLGLQAAVEWQLGRFERLSGIVCVLKCEGMAAEVSLGDACTLAVFRILQEALSNIVRHAFANKVEVELVASEWQFSMRVRDDGIGFDPEAGKSVESFGLVGISERVSALGGEFVVESGGGRGTLVVVSIPLAEHGFAAK